MFRYNKVKHINDLPNYEAYSVVLNGFFDGKKVHIFENISDCIDQSTLARECGLSTCHVDIRFIVDKEHFPEFYERIKQDVSCTNTDSKR